MTFDEFQASMEKETPPKLSPELLALWHDGRGNWDRAHEFVQDGSTPDSAWIHGYLHRKEGDSGNAAYWYSRARKPYPDGLALEDEWAAIVSTLLGR